MRQGVAHRFHGRHDVDVDAFTPTLGCVLGTHGADIGNEMVDTAAGREAVDPLLERRIVGNVERRSCDAALPTLPVLLAFPDQLGVARAETHRRSFGEEGIDNGPADALGATGDQNALALETEDHVY